VVRDSSQPTVTAYVHLYSNQIMIILPGALIRTTTIDKVIQAYDLKKILSYGAFRHTSLRSFV